MVPRFIVLSALGLVLCGCVPQDKYNALKLEKDALVEQLGQAQADASAAKASADAWKAQLDKLAANGGDLQALTAAQAKEIGELRAQLGDLSRKYDEAMKNPGNIATGPLTVELSNALEQFAKDNPDLVEFDRLHGTVKFKSDVTFAKGSADLTANAKTAIARFGQILNSPAARDYEFLVAGHTDNTPVSNPDTIKHGHLNNWFLSSHRAITVGSALAGQGISQRRLGVLGYADQRPIASNATADGQARNRRVEVLILPTTYRGPAADTGAAPRKAVPAARPNLNKDGGPATPAPRPAMNK